MISPIAGQDWPALNRYSADNKLLGLPEAEIPDTVCSISLGSTR